MKARIKVTGEIVKVSCGIAVAGNVLYRDVNTNATYTGDELEPAEPNWQNYRIQAAIAAMSIVADDGYNVRNEQHLIAKYAVQLADELIEELKKGGQDD